MRRPTGVIGRRDVDAPGSAGAGQIVVGFDGSPASQAALEWAAEDARRSGRQVRLVNAIRAPTATAGADLIPVGPVLLPIGTDQTRPSFQTTVDSCWQMVQYAVRQTRHSMPELDVDGDAIIGDPGHVLLEAAGGDAVVVVGDRETGEPSGATPRSTSEWLAVHAHTTVVIVRGTIRPGPANPVVLGLDWYDPSSAAISFSRETAADWDAPLVVISALAGEPAATPVGFGNDPEQPESSAWPNPDLSARVTTAVRSALGDAERSGEDVQIVVEAESSATAILRHAANAGLIVVGSHGRGPLRALLLGSVGQEILRRSPCSVAVAHRQ